MKLAEEIKQAEVVPIHPAVSFELLPFATDWVDVDHYPVDIQPLSSEIGYWRNMRFIHTLL
jgi:hypothetical protein